MGFMFSIKMIDPLKNEETKKKAILKFWWSEFENHILTKSDFCNHCLHYIEQDLLCLWVKTKGIQLFSLLQRISDLLAGPNQQKPKLSGKRGVLRIFCPNCKAA